MTTEWKNPGNQKRSIREVLARNVRICRAQMGISQEELAHLCGLHRTYIGAVERGEQNISADNIEKIARAIGISPSQILEEWSDP